MFSTLNLIINDTGLKSGTDEEVIAKTHGFLNNRFREHVMWNEISPDSIPKYQVLYKKGEEIKLIPADVLTMYMSNTIQYDMWNPEHYKTFTENMDGEPDFVSFVTRDLRKKTLFSKIKYYDGVIGTDVYVDNYKIYPYDADDYDLILDTLKFEFNTRMSIFRFDDFKTAVQEIIYRVGILSEISRGKLDANVLWNIMFDYINISGVTNFSRQCNTEGFRSIRNIYTHTERKVPPPKVEITPKNARTDMLKFIGLGERFNHKQLKHRYRKLAIRFHPDKGGDNEKFLYLKQCYDTLKGSL